MPEFWRQGYAQEIGRAAIAAALLRRPELPVTAFSLEANASSHRTIRSLGLSSTWRGPDAGNPDPNAIRVLYADRPLEPGTLRALTER